jgi:AcrR family transcriptional regulator
LPAEGLRSRKKGKTRLAIENAALDLFAEHGFEDTTVDDIAERAEVSKATFFRYFNTKADVIFSVETYQLDALYSAIVKRPTQEDDLTAIHHAVLEEWVPRLNPDRVARQGRAASSSPVLRGLSLDLGIKWQTIIASAVARRRRLEVTNQRCWLLASMSLAIFSNATNNWLFEGCPGDLATAIDHAFRLQIQICGDMQRAQPPKCRSEGTRRRIHAE